MRSGRQPRFCQVDPLIVDSFKIDTLTSVASLLLTLAWTISGVSSTLVNFRPLTFWRYFVYSIKRGDINMFPTSALFSISGQSLINVANHDTRNNL